MSTTLRMVRRLPARAVCWFDHEVGWGVTDGGRRVSTVPRPSVGALLAALPAEVEVVNLTGGRPGVGAEGFHAWVDGELGPFWEPAGHFLKRLTMPILRYRDRSTVGRSVEIQRAAAWFGDGDYSPVHCRDAMALVAELVGERFGDGAMRVRPAATGQELLLRTVPYEGWECPDDETAELIRSTAGQGRWEHHRPSSIDVDALELGELVEYDGRFMYAALCRELPAGPVVHGQGDGGFDEYVRARYRCEWRVPDGWGHVGLLPMKHTDAATWVYPRVPGVRAKGWIDAVELHLARRHGWEVKVLEHLAWPQRFDPLGRWARELISAREAVRLRALANGVSVEAAGLARAALRAVCLFGLGSFQGRPYMLTHSAPLASNPVLPEGAVEVTIDGDRMIWQTPAERNQRGPHLAHPEWPATVYARCRVRMLSGPKCSGALHVPVGDLVGIHADALYLASDPRWPDDGNPGRLRHKATWPGPHSWPVDDSELQRLVRSLRRKDDDVGD